MHPRRTRENELFHFTFGCTQQLFLCCKSEANPSTLRVGEKNDCFGLRKTSACGPIDHYCTYVKCITTRLFINARVFMSTAWWTTAASSSLTRAISTTPRRSSEVRGTRCGRAGAALLLDVLCWVSLVTTTASLPSAL